MTFCMTRAVRSCPPPAPPGTISSTFFSGFQPCAEAANDHNADIRASAAAAAKGNGCRGGVMRYNLTTDSSVMALSPLTALSPLDGRYHSKLTPLRDTFSELGLIRA